MTRKTPFLPKCKRAPENFFKNNAEARKNRSPHLNLGQICSGVGLFSRRHIQCHGIDTLGKEQLATVAVVIVEIDIVLQRTLKIDLTAVLSQPELVDPSFSCSPIGVGGLLDDDTFRSGPLPKYKQKWGPCIQYLHCRQW